MIRYFLILSVLCVNTFALGTFHNKTCKTFFLKSELYKKLEETSSNLPSIIPYLDSIKKNLACSSIQDQKVISAYILKKLERNKVLAKNDRDYNHMSFDKKKDKALKELYEICYALYSLYCGQKSGDQMVSCLKLYKQEFSGSARCYKKLLSIDNKK